MKMIYMTLKVGEPPVIHNEEVADTYQLVSGAVEGYIEALRISETCVLWINEEGKIHDLKPNFMLTDRAGNQVDYVSGNVIFTGVTEEGDTVSLSEEDIALIQERFTDRFHFKHYA
jgi:hypothetical protein